MNFNYHLYRALFILSFVIPLYAADFNPQYNPGPEMSVARMAHCTISTDSSHLLLLGGHGTGFTALGSGEYFTNIPDSFRTIQMNYVHDGFAFTRLLDGRILIAGGAANLGSAPGYNHAELYDPLNNIFTATTSLNYPRTNCSATTLNDGRALIVGGWYDNSSGTYGEIYNPDSTKFSLTGALNTPRANPLTVHTTDGNAVIIGGYPIFGGAYLQQVELYDAATNTFSVLTDTLFSANDPDWMPFPFISYNRSLQTQRLRDGRYVFMAYKVRGDSSVYTLFTFDPSDKALTRFVTQTPLPSTATDNLFAPLIDADRSVAYILAQRSGNDPVQIRLIAVDLTDGSVYIPQEYYNLPAAYYLSSAGLYLLEDGRIMVSGGHSQTGYNTNFSPHAHTLFVTPNYTSTGMKEQTILPSSLDLRNYPNPFNNQTVLEFTLPRSSRVEVHIYNALGQRIDALSYGVKAAGRHSVSWNGKFAPSGIYYFLLKTRWGSEIKKAALIK